MPPEGAAYRAVPAAPAALNPHRPLPGRSPPPTCRLETEDAPMMSELMANLWSFLAQALAARSGRYWLT